MDTLPDFKQKWPAWKERIRQEHPDLTDEDLHYDPENEADLILRLGSKLKKNREEIYNWLHLMG